VGLADSTYATNAAAIIAAADEGLLTAKREGRDQLIIAPKPGVADRSEFTGSEWNG
jgi:PleD family two-component response regulator